MITENISKKPKRGRPYTVFKDADDKRELVAECPDVRTERSVANRMYLHDALSVIGKGNEPQFVWLADASTGRYKRTILTELGRIRDDSLRVDVARQLCEKKPKTVEAVGLIRSRRGVLRPPSVDGLDRTLRKAVNKWLAANPSGTSDQVYEALQWQAAAIWSMSESHPGLTVTGTE